MSYIDAGFFLQPFSSQNVILIGFFLYQHAKLPVSVTRPALCTVYAVKSYVYPLLEGDKFIGRIDLKADRKKGVIYVNQIWLEPKTK